MKIELNKEKIFEYIILALILLYSFFIPAFSNIYPFNYLGYVFAGLLIVFISIYCFIIKKRFYFNYLFIAYIGFIFCIMITQLVNRSLKETPLTVLSLSLLSIFLFEFAKTYSKPSRVFFAIMMGGVLFALYFTVYYSRDIFALNLGKRLGSYFNDLNQLGRMISVYFLIAFVSAFTSEKSVYRIVCGFFSFLFFAILLLTGSISNILVSFLIAFVFVFIFLNGVTKKIVFLLIVDVLIFALVSLYYLPFMAYYRERIDGIIAVFFKTENRADGSALSRLMLSVDALLLFFTKPLFGFGYFSTNQFILENSTAHNNFFQLLLDFGIFGFLFYESIFVIVALYGSFKDKRLAIGTVPVIFLFVFQFFLTTYHQKMDYLIVPVSFAVLADVKLTTFAYENIEKNQIRVLDFKHRILYLFNNCLDNNLLRMKLIVFGNNIRHLFNKIFSVKKSLKKEDAFDIEHIMKRKYFFCHDYYLLNSFYGHSHILKRYSGFERKIPLTIEHGLYFGNVFLDEEIKKNGLNGIITMSKYREQKIKDVCELPVEMIGPYIAYAKSIYDSEKILRIKSEIGKTLVVFPSHSIDYVTSSFDTDELVNEILKVKKSKGFETVVICLFYKDILINEKIVDVYKNYDFVVTTCGFKEDPLFLDRQRTLLELADMTMSNGVGTHIGYSIYLNKPHYYFNQKVNKIIEGSNEHFKKQLGNESAINDRIELGDLFSKCSMKITKKQKEMCNRIFGFDYVRKPDELLEILNKHYLDIFKLKVGISSINERTGKQEETIA